MKFRARNLPRHYRFEYTPRYYDPEKERLEQMKVNYDETEDVGQALKGQIARGFANGGRTSRINFQTQRSAQSAASNKRLFYIIIVLALLAYLLLRTNLAGLLALIEAQ